MPVGLFHIMLTMDISQRYIFTDRHTFYKSPLTVEMLLHVTAGKLICAANNPHWLAIFVQVR